MDGIEALVEKRGKGLLGTDLVAYIQLSHACEVWTITVVNGGNAEDICHDTELGLRQSHNTVRGKHDENQAKMTWKPWHGGVFFERRASYVQRRLLVDTKRVSLTHLLCFDRRLNSHFYPRRLTYRHHSPLPAMSSMRGRLISVQPMQIRSKSSS